MIKRKLYFDNDCNACICGDARDYRRVPAEKPFEGRTKAKKRTEDQYRENKANRKKENLNYQSYQSGCKYTNYLEPEYKPKLVLDFEDVKSTPYPKVVSSETTEEPLREKRILNSQYPCVCFQPPQCQVPQQYDHYQACDCGCNYKKCEDPKCSYPRRAWNAVKSKTKSFFFNRQEIDRHQKEQIIREYLENNSPYLYPYPIQCCQPIPKKKRKNKSKCHYTKTRKSYKGQTYNSSLSDGNYTTRDSFTDEPKICPKRQYEMRNHKETQFATPIVPASRKDCCCVCDVDICDCRCCCTGQCAEKPDINRNTQTSIQNIRERFTQTDFPKKCCRCCKCCANKSKCYPLQAPNQNNRGNNAGKCVGCDNCMYISGPCLPTPNFQCYNCFNNHKKENSPNNNDQNTTKQKVQIVKTNSVQCLPTVENKSTSCDGTQYSTRMNELMKDLWDGKYDLTYDKQNVDIPSYTPNIDWANRFLQSMTTRKKSHFSSGLFSSPLTGKQYTLNTPEINFSPILFQRNLPKPLNISDIFSDKISKNVFNSYGEHNKLITDICEAILKKHDDDMCIGNSQFICKDDLSSDQELRYVNNDDRKVNQSTQKSRMIAKLIPKSMLKLKKPSKQSVVVTTSNIPLTKPSSIPTKIKNPKLKKTIKKNVKKITSFDLDQTDKTPSDKNAVNKASNFEGYYASGSHDQYQNTFTNSEKGIENLSNSSIDYERVKNLDCSNITFKRQHDMNASEYFRQKYINQKNFILNNLPAFNSSISNEYQIKSLLSDEKLTSLNGELIENTSSVLLQPTPEISTTLVHPGDAKVNVKNEKVNLGTYQNNIDKLLDAIKESAKEKTNDFNFFGKKT